MRLLEEDHRHALIQAVDRLLCIKALHDYGYEYPFVFDPNPGGEYYPNDFDVLFNDFQDYFYKVCGQDLVNGFDLFSSVKEALPDLHLCEDDIATFMYDS